jgi:tripartite-type tricarboxylate transporter receptor subunit TctC
VVLARRARGTPKEIVDASIARSTVLRETRDREAASRAWLEADTMSPEELGQHLKKEAAIWAKVARDAKLKPE